MRAHHRPQRLLLFMFALGFAAGCAAAELELTLPPSEGGVPLDKMGADYLPGDLEWAVTPHPQHERWSNLALPFKNVEFKLDEAVPAAVREQLEELFGAPAAGGTEVRIWVEGSVAELPWNLKDVLARAPSPEGYALAVGVLDGRSVAVVAGKSPWGAFWGVQTLRQLVRRDANGVPHVRAGSVLDYPRFLFRGNKRPEVWEHRYKANYAWGTAEKLGKMRELGRVHGAWVRHIDPLDASDERIQLLMEGGESVVKGKTVKILGVRQAYEQGCREFTLKYDDTDEDMTKETSERFGGDYYKAQIHFLRTMFDRIRALDPKNRVFFMPQPYWLNYPGIEQYAAKLRAAGGIPAEMGLSFCGIEVFSKILPTKAVDEYRALFGSSVPAQIYDNVGRGGDLFAISGRDLDLWKSVECIFPERGTALTRITVHDYLWNPESYDPARALTLACRELAAGNPDIYKPLRAFVDAWNARRNPPPSAAPRAEQLADYADATKEFEALWAPLEPALQQSPLAVEVKLAAQIVGTEYTWGECDRLAGRRAQTPHFIEHGLRELKVAKLGGTLTIDGKLDEEAWRAAEAHGAFVRHGWTENFGRGLLSDSDQAVLRVLRDETHLYFAVEARSAKEIKIPGWAQEKWKDLAPGSIAPYAWRVPCFELFLDHDHDHNDYVQIVMNAANLRHEVHAGDWGGALPSGGHWESGVEFKVTVAEDLKNAVLEARLPFKNLGGAPAPGSRWGLQVHKNVGAFGVWTYQYHPTSFSHGPSQLGHLIFE